MKKLIVALIIEITVLCCLLPFVPKQKEDNSPVIISEENGTYEIEPESKAEIYIVNNNTNKFHKPYCADAERMSPYNKKTFTCTRDELIDKGYSPCKHCCP